MTHDLPFFVREGDRYHPTEASRGYWTPQSINGRLIVGLLGYELERVYGDPDWQPTRLTVDMHRLPDRSPVDIVTRVIRSGGRLRLVEADFMSRGEPMGRATCQFLRRTEAPPGTYWTTSSWDVPAPEQTPRGNNRDRHWDMRIIDGGLSRPLPRRVWLRETRELVGGVAPTPFTRVAACADFASPLSNSGSEALGYINSDVTLYLHRLPVGEWIGFEVSHHQAAAGVANGACWLFDQQGPIGSSTVAAISQARRGETPKDTSSRS